MRLKGIRSLRELTRILDVDRRLRHLCLIHGEQRGYPRSVISRFTKRVGAEVLQLIIEEKVVHLLRFRARDADVLLDASFVKARSIRHPDNPRTAYSDPDALVGRNGRGYDLGYKLHVAVDHRTMLPLASILAPANDNEKKQAPGLVEKARALLSRVGGMVRSIVADSQISSRAVRSLADSVIPYAANQAGEGVLRVDRRFRTHGPPELLAEYHKRPLVESVFSWLKTQYGLIVNNVRRIGCVSVYALLSLLCVVLVREAAECLGRPDKAVSPTFFNV